ncbi:AAA family ATPase [Flavobacterium sp. PL002]|uniref:AAA family ATPase n=1 Tax=Flavobacterium sp. PL002 TaxID=1897058 RepID=UPI0019E56BB0|nr:AAA family ATPase [Flavobacterium sp. PL002]MBE0392687.1 5-methylcytosine-specific restriction enzyme B [Flavobacterium sp. PL002]
MSRIFFRMQMKAGSNGDTITDEVLSQNKITSDIEYAGERFLHLKCGSVVLIHKGSIPIALVKIVDKIPKDKIKEPSFGIDYYVEIISDYSSAIVDFPELNELYKNIPFQGTFAQVENGNATFNRINKWYKLVTKQKKMQDKIDLLEYKKQIILQGPPGTGKTRLAKMMAEEMTKVNKLERPIDVISNHFKTYKPDESSIALREKINELVKNFQEKFKKEDLKNLPLENYALGTDDKDGFCYWQEYILTDTGKYNGQADKGKIYWKNDEQRYVKSGFLQNIVNDDEAMTKMAELLDNIVNEKHNIGIDYPIGKGFILKMLNSYYPEKYFPISNEKCLTNALKLVGENTAGLNYIQKNTRLQEIFEEKKANYKTDITNNEFMYFLFGNFNLKKEVKLENDELLVEGDYKIIQFHPAYSYEDFVRGISAKTNDKGDVNYKVENRILIEFANEALDNPKAKYVLIIDEINRANLPSVLGELIYALEYRYSHKKNNFKEAAVESLYDISEDDGESNRVLLLPDNLYIIGTMNTADRSVGHIDYAIKRRFAFVNVPPTADAIDDVVKDPILKAKAKVLYHKVADLFNEDKSKNVYLQSDFKAKDVQLGHSYFLVENEKQLELKLEFEIKPLLNEYVRDGILEESALAQIDAL